MELPGGLASDANAALRTQLGEVKVIHHNPTRYIASDSDPGTFGAAVRRRAHVISLEYERNARRLDTQYGTTPVGAVGPCLLRLRTFGRVAAFVFGASGEASEDFE